MSERFEVETVVIGAGVVGLAVARELTKHSSEVLLLEQNSSYGMEISSRNSEVIHAGIYYPKDSLKAKLCVRGKKQLYDYCASHKIPHNPCGKLIVATNTEQESTLRALQQKATANGVSDIKELSKEEVAALEPTINCTAALLSPSTGIIDSHSLMTQFLADFEREGGQLALNTQITRVETKTPLVIHCEDGTEVVAQRVINAAGLSALRLLSDNQNSKAQETYRYYFAKGSYFSYSGKTNFKHLVYPVPVQGGLGIHLTLDMQNQARFGPDVEWLTATNPADFTNDSSLMKVDPSKRRTFYEAISEYWPDIEERRLKPDYAGIRPKISGPDEPAGDFVIQSELDHGVPGLVNLIGIESPGLTSCLAIAEHVSRLFKD